MTKTKKKSTRPPPAAEDEQRGAKGSVLSEERRRAVTLTYKEFDEMVESRPLMTKEQAKEVLEWKKQRANQLLDDANGSFADCTQDGVGDYSRPLMYRKILEMYKNRYYYRHADDVSDNRQQATSNPAPPTGSLGAVLSQRTEEELNRLARVHFLGLLKTPTGQEYFNAVNDELIASLAQTDKISLPVARKRAWEACEEKEKYEKMVEEHNPEEVRTFLPHLLQMALRDVLKRRAAGDVALKASIAWRGSDGSVHTTIITAAYDAAVDRELELVIPDVRAEQVIFAAQADAILPLLHRSSPVFSVNEAGLPLWTPLDAHKATPDQVRNHIKQFISALWVASYGMRRPIPLVPYDDIHQKPELFYDAELFVLPARLDTTYAPDLFKLVDFFEDCSKKDTPFQLRPQEGSPIVMTNIPPVDEFGNDPDLDTNVDPASDGGSGAFDAGSPAVTGENAPPLQLPVPLQPPVPLQHSIPQLPAPPQPPVALQTPVPVPPQLPAPLDPSQSPIPPPATGSKPTPPGPVLGPKTARKKAAAVNPKKRKTKEDAPEADDGSGPPKLNRANKKQRPNPDENQAPTQSQDEQAPHGNRLRQRKEGRAVVEKPKSSAALTKRVPVSQRWTEVIQVIRNPTPPLPM